MLVGLKSLSLRSIRQSRRVVSTDAAKKNSEVTSQSKAVIPKSLKNSVWETYIGKEYQAKCAVDWCTAVITPFTFEVGHNIPESKGGSTTLDNLRPICSQCNKSMGNRYTIEQFSKLFKSVENDSESNQTKQKIRERLEKKRRFCCL